MEFNTYKEYTDQEQVDALVKIIQRGKKAKLFRAPKPEAAAIAIVAAIEGYYLIAATARDLIPRGTAASATKLMAKGLLSTK